MNRIVRWIAAAAAVSFVGATTLVAQPTPGTTPAPKAEPKAKAKAKAKQVPVEGSYSAEAEAKSACGPDTVVWVNTSSKIYHAQGTRDYGKTRRGFYMCQPNADKSGFRAVKGKAKKAK